MRVMKQQPIIAARSMVRTDSTDPGRIIPFVNNDQIDRIQRLVQIESCRFIKGAAQTGVNSTECLERGFAVLPQQVGKTPSAGRFKDA